MSNALIVLFIILLAGNIIVQFRRFQDGETNEKAIARIFRYSFDPIGWKYSGLTTMEKRALSKKEFEAIKQKYRNLR